MFRFRKNLTSKTGIFRKRHFITYTMSQDKNNNTFCSVVRCTTEVEEVYASHVQIISCLAN